jgi:hypothetical protein
VINEVDETLRALVKAEVVSGTDVDVVFDAPTREWASRRNKPTLDLYLYDIREDLRRHEFGMVEVLDDTGRIVSRGEPPRFFKLSYLVTAWTQRPEDEHRLLAASLGAFVRYSALPPEYKTDLLVEQNVPLFVQIAAPPPENRQVPDVWSSLGGDLKPSLDLQVDMPIFPATFQDVAAAVMAPLRLKATGYQTSEAEDEIKSRRHPSGEPPVEAPVP